MILRDPPFTHIDRPDLVDTGNLEAREVGSSRFYRLPSGQWVPSVTTVTGWSKRDFFEKWAKDPANAKEKDRAATRGNAIHDAIELYMANNPSWSDELEPDHKDLVLQVRKYLDRVDNIHAQEVSLFSETLGIAGRVDCIGEYDGVLSIIDFKGSTKNKKSEYIQNYFQQGTAYSLAHQEMTGIIIPQVVIIIACETGIPQVFKRRAINHVDDLAQAVKTFKEESEDYSNIDMEVLFD